MAKLPLIYNGMYIGDMNKAKIDSILQTRENKCIDGLTKMIFDFPPDLVLRSIEEEQSIRKIIKDEGLDYRDYIGNLRDYQTVGTAFLYFSNRSILGDGVGCGKTAEISALLNFLKQKGEMNRFLMVVETSALGQTQCELMRFTGMRVVQLPSEAPKLRRAIKKTDWNTVDGIVIKHSTLRSDVFSNWVALNLKEDGKCRLFNTFILDESSVIKKKETKTYTYTKNICNIVDRVHFLNATTFETNIMDIYNQVDMMYPGLLPSKSHIEKEFCTFGFSKYWVSDKDGPKQRYRRDLTGYKNQERFKESLKLVYFGRCKKDIGLDKPHIYKVYEVYPSNEQSVALAQGYRSMEVLNCPSLVPEIDIKTNRADVPKIDRLVQLVENEFREDSVMVYCFHVDAQYRIAEELTKIGRKPVVLNGESDDSERWAIQTAFNKGEYDVIITNIQKSLNLYGGDVCIFYSSITNPSKMEQTRGRIDRNIDDRTKTFILLLYKGTDEYNFFMNTVRQRAKDARELTIDAKTAVDFFMDSMQQDEE